MIRAATVTRRNLLRTLLCLSAFALPWPPHALAKWLGSRAHEPLALSLATFFSHKESAKIIGLQYLRFAPKEADVHLLVELICSHRPERRRELTIAEVNKRRQLLLLQQRQDFEHGRIVKLHGWILSETEVRLCALAALV
jgi:hypothetical protein